LAELRRLVSQAEQRVRQLCDREEALVAELEAVRSELMVIAGGAAGRPRAAKTAAKRGRRPGGKRRGRKGSGPGGKTVTQALAEILRSAGKPMRVVELTAALRKSKFPTKSKNLEKMVQIMLNGSDLFRRVRRGVYAVR
jgi:hypothetical protein